MAESSFGLWVKCCVKVSRLASWCRAKGRKSAIALIPVRGLLTGARGQIRGQTVEPHPAIVAGATCGVHAPANRVKRACGRITGPPLYNYHV
jgi:hypothetical protein